MGDRFVNEREILQRGITSVAGVDEAGRGPLAGPVVAAAVIFPTEWIQTGLPESLEGLNDSKRLTPRRRDDFFKVLHTLAGIRFGIASVSADEVDRINILQATHVAMRGALAQLLPPPEHVLVDGVRVGLLEFPQTAIIKGDQKSYTIAAASVLAKVTRDRIMEGYDCKWPAYGFAKHKGYGTARHVAALFEHGPCPIHRRSFTPVVQMELFSGVQNT